MRLGFKEAKLIEISNGVVFDDMHPTMTRDEVRRTLGIAADAPIICAPGNIRRWKGQHVFLKALVNVVKRFPTVIGVVVGSCSAADVEYSRELHELTRSWGIERNVKFLDHQKELINIMAASDIVVHASVEPEPFGRVVIEAMALGIPVIGSNAGGVSEIIEHGVSGCLHNPGDADELSKELVVLLSDPEGAKQLGERGRERVRLCFDARQTARRVEEVYAQMLGKGAVGMR